ncbi:MAG: ACP S-malonyltransferase [Pseudomonadota bacterium]
MTSAVLICPGRGTYNKPELGTLSRTFPDADLMAVFDARRTALGQETITDLDSAARFSSAKHTRGDNASALIYAASLGDRLSIRDEIEIVAVTGNSMGWYSALACGGAVSADDGFVVANTMGTLMQKALIGGQLVYPHVAEDWSFDAARKAELLGFVRDIDAQTDQTLKVSIDFGGMLVFAGDEAGLSTFEAAVPALDRFPMRLPNHGAFHTSLMTPVSDAGKAALGPELFGQPALPLIDGRGAIWWPRATDVDTLREYTLGHQVTETYDFTRSIVVAAREFAPDLFIIAGPGTTLGGAVAQSLIAARWRGMNTKSDFQSLQAEAPILISMGRNDQRSLVI